MSPQLNNVSKHNARLLVYKDCLEFDVAKLPVCNVDDLLSLVMELNIVFLSVRVAESAWTHLLNEAFFFSCQHLDLILHHEGVVIVFDQLPTPLSFIHFINYLIVPEKLLIVHLAVDS